MANSVAEAVIGAVVLAAAAGFVLYAGQSRGLQIGGDSYPLTASFQAQMTLAMRGDLQIPDDSDVKISSESLLGGNVVEITPGASEDLLQAGDEIVNTQGSVSLLNLLMRFGTGQ